MPPFEMCLFIFIVLLPWPISLYKAFQFPKGFGIFGKYSFIAAVLSTLIISFFSSGGGEYASVGFFYGMFFSLPVLVIAGLLLLFSMGEAQRKFQKEEKNKGPNILDDI